MPYCGVLNLDKPAGVTSRDVVNRVQRLVRPAKVGHAGTLDPLATGVLVVCVGHATRLISLVQEGRKTYSGRFVLGQRSDTDDSTGKLVPGGDWAGITEDDVASLLPEFLGRIDQVPPQFSAVHVQGQRAYALARRGETIELEARPVEIFSIRLTEFQPPEFQLHIECGSGTYVRSIGRDLGELLGCGAVMTQLRRLSVGPFEVDRAVTPEDLTPASLAAALRPASCLVQGLPQRRLTHDELTAVRQGQSIAAQGSERVGSTALDLRTALIDPTGQLVGLAELDLATARLRPRIVFPAELEK